MMVQALRWGIIGGAGIAQGAVMPAIKQSQYGVLAAVASRNIDKAQQLADQFQLENAYDSYESLLADDSIDAVYIPLPNHLHLEWTLRAAAAGKHVLCEKPLALTAAEAQEMVDACQKAGIHLAEAFMYRHHPRMEQILQLLDQGVIGQIRGIHAAFTFNDAANKGNIRFRKEWGGGSLYDVGCYPLSAARWIMRTEPVAVTVHAMFSPEHDDVDMMASGIVEFADSVALTFDCGMWADHRQQLEILGSEGRIVLPLAFTAHGEDAKILLIKNGKEQVIVTEAVNPYVNQMDHFARAVAGEKVLPLQPDDSVRNMALVEACLRSAAEKRRVEL